MKVYVEISQIVVVDLDIGPGCTYETLEDAAADPDFGSDYLNGDLRMVEWQGHEVITEPDMIAWLDQERAPWVMSVRWTP